MRLKLLAALGLAVGLAACATGPIAPPQPTLESLQAIRAADIPPMRVGEFKLAPGKPASMDRVIVVRAGTASPPEGKSFARYLGATVENELRSAGKLDAASPIVLEGLLTESQANAEMPKGRASLGATFWALKNGREVYRKDLAVSTTYDSEFLGAIAIPSALGEYTTLYSKLAAKLLTDPELKAAVSD